MRALASLALAALASCRQAEPGPAALASASAAASPAPEAAPGAAAPRSSEELRAEMEAQQRALLRGMASAEPAPRRPRVDPDLALTDRGFRPGEALTMLGVVAAQRGAALPPGALAHRGCAPRRVGSLEGYLCEGDLALDSASYAMSSMSLLVVSGQSLREVFRFPSQALAFDAPTSHASLRVDYDDARGVVTLTDGRRTCDEAVEAEDGTLDYQRLIDRLCRARGQYALTGGRFVRRGPAPAPLRWPARKRLPARPAR